MATALEVLAVPVARGEEVAGLVLAAELVADAAAAKVKARFEGFPWVHNVAVPRLTSARSLRRLNVVSKPMTDVPRCARHIEDHPRASLQWDAICSVYSEQ